MRLGWQPKGDGIHRTVEAVDGWLALGAPEQAWHELNTLKAIDATQPAVLHRFARVLVALGHMSQARQTVRTLAKIAPQLRLALLNDPLLDALWR